MLCSGWDSKNRFRVKVIAMQPLPKLAGLLVIDNFKLKTNMFVLVNGQDDVTQNGIYMVYPDDWIHFPMAEEGWKLEDQIIAVTEGMCYGETFWARDPQKVNGYTLYTDTL